MLKALELVGFKSFADKTRFEFPRGITVIVGPNGSGKSNIVDAIKWALGEQSAKSLRGQEMADVIFKGSGSGTRRPMNTAEATLVFENTGDMFTVDTPEVHVTRRVYRSGEGEYLINGQPSRLRDIRDLFRGTGAGTEAYSLIEQGKVDVLLSASPLDRRAIFEEAAGISRFKAKKIEAGRRLERVEQNLLRLADIVDEVESRLRNVRSQASKARRYKEYSERLQNLRTQVGLSDWMRLSEKLQQANAEITALGEKAAEAGSQVETVEAEALSVETEIGQLSETVREFEARIARNRERIATCESSIEHERQRAGELEEEAARYRGQVAAMNTRAGGLLTQVLETSRAVNQAEADHGDVTERLTENERILGELEEKHNRLRSHGEQLRSLQMKLLLAEANLGKQTSGSESKIAAAGSAVERCRRRLAELEPACRFHSVELRDLRSAETKHFRQVELHVGELDASQKELTSCRRQYKSRQQKLIELQAKHAATGERAAVLEELEKRLEGLGSCVKQVLARARRSALGPYSHIRGLVADVLHAEVDTAPLIEAALGQRADYVVVEGNELFDLVQQEPLEGSGQVGFIRLDRHSPASRGQRIKLDGKPGVIGRADRFLTADEHFASLVLHLLGHTWLVEKLSDAVEYSRAYPGQLRFVSRSGEVLEEDGTLIVGSRDQTSGLISRRSELRDLRQQIVELDQAISTDQREVSRLDEAIGQLDQQVRRRTEEHRQAAAALADHRVRAEAAQERFEQLDKQRLVVLADLGAAEGQHDSTKKVLIKSRQQLDQTQGQLADVNDRMQAGTDQLERLDANRQDYLRQTTTAKVDLAKSEQRLESLRVRMAQFHEDQQERNRAIEETRNQLAQSTLRRQQSDRNVLQTSSEVAQLYLRKESVVAETGKQVARRVDLGEKRSMLSAESQQLRQKLRKYEDALHRMELEAGEVRHQRTTLTDRLREDYGIELAQLNQEPTEEEQRQRSEVEEEISTLRRKIGNIGAVNMEALAELNQLTERYDSLSAQFTDLKAAKNSLEKIIRSINADSRRLFSETLEAIRSNFRALFRKVFGGGEADIVLEEGADILESGIEVVATPPGKHSLGLSLLSGGERALTAVTLLLAVFQYRPSPFCVLDEVDGPLDEANIARFIGVLKEFLNSTKFVIVTHSKKTMTAATTLYGVTMQESGVSKRVSVQFDDVSEDGHIRRDVLERESHEPEKENDERGVA